MKTPSQNGKKAQSLSILENNDMVMRLGGCFAIWLTNRSENQFAAGINYRRINFN